MFIRRLKTEVTKRRKGTYSSLWINPWQSYGASPAICHTYGIWQVTNTWVWSEAWPICLSKAIRTLVKCLAEAVTDRHWDVAAARMTLARRGSSGNDDICLPTGVSCNEQTQHQHLNTFHQQTPQNANLLKTCLTENVPKTIRYDQWFALENWQASCQFILAHKLKENYNCFKWN